VFNLLMSYGEWHSSRDTMEKGRALEYTPEHLKDRFQPDKELDLQAVCDLPLLLAREAGAEEPARVGRLNRVRLEGKTYHLEYSIDPDIPPISASLMRELGPELGIGGSDAFEWNRTHWAIKDADLYQVLLKHGFGPNRLKPTGFDFTDDPDDKLVAVMMPFGPEFKDVYTAIKQAAKAAGLRCQRADDIWEEDVVIQDVVNLICKARVVVCDLSDRNPNVFYEMGIAHSLGKDVVMLAQNKNDVPFDVQQRRYLRYLHNDQGLAKMTEGLQSRLERLAAK
jgi:hypothetical protein